MALSQQVIQRLAGAAIALGIAAALAMVVVRSFWPARPSHTVRIEPGGGKSVESVTLSNGVVLRPVDLPTALLFDCYEHALENVPPRTDTSARQRAWTAPTVPLDALREGPKRSPIANDASPVVEWLIRWDEHWQRGIPATSSDLDVLDSLLSQPNLRFQPLYNIGLAIGFLDGDEHAAVWLRHAMVKALRETERGISKSCGRPRQLKRLFVLRRRTRRRRSGLAASRSR